MQKPWYRDPLHWVAIVLLGSMALYAAIMLVRSLIGQAMLDGMDSADWAAWVQAIGSIGAILVSVWLVNMQHVRESARRDLEAWRAERAPAVDARGLLRMAQLDVEGAAAAAVGGGGIDRYLGQPRARRNLKSRRRVIEAFNWTALKPSGVAVDFLEGRDAIIAADDLLDYYCRRREDPVGQDLVVDLGAALRGHADALESSADALSRDLDYPGGVYSDKVYMDGE